MNKITMYQCSICKEIYDTVDACTNCENRHTYPVAVQLPKNFKPIIDETSGTPKKIVVKMKNKKIFLYEMIQEVSHAEWDHTKDVRDTKDESVKPREEYDPKSGWTLSYCGNCGAKFWGPTVNYCEVCGTKVKR